MSKGACRKRKVCVERGCGEYRQSKPHLKSAERVDAEKQRVSRESIERESIERESIERERVSREREGIESIEREYREY